MKARMLFANGYEEVEALTVIDLLRRAGIETLMVAADDEEKVTGRTNITVVMDEKLSDISGDVDIVILPGGIPGVPNLIKNPKAQELVTKQANAGRYVAAICAGPTALGAWGLLEGKKATCYPGCEGDLHSKEASTNKVVVDGNVITSRGVGTAIDFALAIIEELISKEKADQIASSIVYER